MKLKINPVPTFIAVAISFLIAFGFYSYGNSELHGMYKFFIVTSIFIYASITLATTLGINFETGRITTVIRTASLIFFIVGLIATILLSILSISLPLIIIIMGILFLLFFLTVYSLSKTNQ